MPNMQHSHWQEPQASQEMLPVTACKRAAELLKSATQESSYMANNVPSQSLNLLSQVMLKAWLCKAQSYLTQNSKAPQSQP